MSLTVWLCAEDGEEHWDGDKQNGDDQAYEGQK
jgi:hypothetical protein